jgi:hypothetical protein
MDHKIHGSSLKEWQPPIATNRLMTGCKAMMEYLRVQIYTFDVATGRTDIPTRDVLGLTILSERRLPLVVSL